MIKGLCLCGSVTFEINSELGVTDACHCNDVVNGLGTFLSVLKCLVNR